MGTTFSRIISGDSHMTEPLDLWWNALGKEFGERTPRLMDEYHGEKGKFFDSLVDVLRIHDRERERAARVTPGMEDAGYLPEARVAYQEQEDIEAEVLNPTTMMNLMQGKDREVIRACSEVYNDWLGEFCSYSPKRLIGVPVIPIDDVGWGVQELKRTAKKGQLKGGPMIALNPSEGAPPYRDPVYDPFWAAAQDLGIPVTIHVATGRSPNPFHFHEPQDDLGEGPRALMVVMCEVMGTLASEFTYGGILDRFPDLKLVCSEFEISWIPWFMFHLDDTLGPVAKRLHLEIPKMKPSDYVKTRMWHGFIDDPFALDAIPHIGADHVLWGTDFPHPGSIGLGTHEYAARVLAPLPYKDQEKIVASNTAHVWGL